MNIFYSPEKFPLLAMRSVIGTLVLGIYCLGEFLLDRRKGAKWTELSNCKLVTLKILGFSVLRAIIPFTVNAYAFTLGARSGLASVINGLSPLFAALLELVFNKSKMNRMLTLGLLTGLLGVIIVFISPVIDSFKNTVAKEWIGCPNILVCYFFLTILNSLFS